MLLTVTVVAQVFRFDCLTLLIFIFHPTCLPADFLPFSFRKQEFHTVEYIIYDYHTTYSACLIPFLNTDPLVIKHLKYIFFSECCPILYLNTHFLYHAISYERVTLLISC